MFARQERWRLAGQCREIVHVVIERLERAVPAIAQHFIKAAFLGFAREKADTERLRLADVRRKFREHGDAARYVKSADANRQAGRQEGTGEIDRTRELIGLHADQSDQRAAALFTDQVDDAVRPYAPVGFVVGVETNFYVRAQDVAATGVFGERIEARQGVGRDGRADPLNRIAVVVVMRRFDHHKMKKTVTDCAQLVTAPLQ